MANTQPIVNYNTKEYLDLDGAQTLWEKTKRYVAENSSGGIPEVNVNLDLTGYVSEGQLQEALKNVDVDLTDYITKEQLDSTLENYVPADGSVKEVAIGTDAPTDEVLWIDTDEDVTDIDLSDYATKDDVSTAIANAQIQGAEVDLTSYAKTSYVDQQIAATNSNFSGYASKSELQTKCNINHKHENYVEKQALDITLGTYATQSYVSEKVAEVATGGEINLDGYVTDQELADALATVEGGTVDTSNLVTKEEISSYYDKTQADSTFAKKTELPDTSQFITSIPSEYVTETELTEAINGVQTADVDLTNYYTKADTYNKEEVDAKIPDTSTFVTGAELDNRITECGIGLNKIVGTDTNYSKYPIKDKVIIIKNSELSDGVFKFTVNPIMSGYLHVGKSTLLTKTLGYHYNSTSSYDAASAVLDYTLTIKNHVVTIDMNIVSSDKTVSKAGTVNTYILDPTSDLYLAMKTEIGGDYVIDLITEIKVSRPIIHTHSIADITDYTSPDLTPYALKTEIPTVPSLDGYATESYVDTAIANVPTGGGENWTLLTSGTSTKADIIIPKGYSKVMVIHDCKEIASGQYYDLYINGDSEKALQRPAASIRGNYIAVVKAEVLADSTYVQFSVDLSPYRELTEASASTFYNNRYTVTFADTAAAGKLVYNSKCGILCSSSTYKVYVQ